MDVENLLKQKVVAYLKHFGLKNEQALAYCYLLKHGPQTVLSLSRGLKTGRTKLYPLLEALAEKQLVAVHERHYGTSYEAQPPEVLDFLIAEQEDKTESLRKNLPAMRNMLESLRTRSPTTSKIIEYHDIDGLKQMNFNLSKASKEFRVLKLAGFNKHLGKHFIEKNHQQFANNKITSFYITNNPHWRLETDVEDYRERSKARYIDPKVFKIEFETYIYNNCVALLSYEKDDIFGVEIYNEKLARQQKQIFNLVWSQAHTL